MKAKWIHSPNYDPEKTEITWFRKSIHLNNKKESVLLHISAVSKYKLYVNGTLTSFGPAKGDRKIWYYDEVSVDLREGRNVIAVAVLHYPVDTAVGNRSVFRWKTPGLYIESEQEEIHTDESWMVCDADSTEIIAEDPFFSPLYIYENAKGLPDFLKDGNADACLHAAAYPEEEPAVPLRPENLKKRRIPLLYLDPSELLHEMVRIPEYSHRDIVIDAKEETCAFLSLSLFGGADSDIRILQAESYVYHIPDPPESYNDLPEKGDRTDQKNGELNGYSDRYTVSGWGTEKHPERYEPFWFRTYRYIRLSIETKDEPLTILNLIQIKTGYPLEVKTKVRVSDPEFMKIWDISLRTLKRCMLETYVDCPFYEQLQYAMDARSEMRYTYAISGDDRLARQCIDDFARGQNADGMVNCSYPDVGINIIPGFAVYVIGMLYDHMMYFGDRDFLRQYTGMADRILGWFRGHLNSDGIVEKTGGPGFEGGNWSFIDWTPEWQATRGVPQATEKGPIAMESLLYSYGLLMTEQISAFLGKEDRAEEIRNERMKLNEAIRRQYLGKNGMIKDGPDTEIYSQHCQVFAALTNLLPEEQLADNLKETLNDPSRYTQCSVAMMPYLFAALRKTGQYELTKPLWDVWKGMLRNHLTTCAEDGLSSRSDCHGWGALILYELPAVILGVHPTEPGFVKQEVKPMTGYFEWMEGEVITPSGIVKVEQGKKG